MELTVSRDIETRVNDVLEGLAGHALIKAEELPDELHRDVPDSLLQVALRWGVPVSQNSDNECLTSAPMEQIEGFSQRRISGSS